MRQVPAVSVVIPVYNQRIYVGGAIDSVLSISDIPLELIVVNDGSTDGTSNVLDEYRHSITLIEQPNRGAATALNRGISAATGELVCWLSADDQFLPGKLEAQTQYLA